MRIYDNYFFNLLTNSSDYDGYLYNLNQKELLNLIIQYKKYILEIEASKKGLKNEINTLYKNLDSFELKLNKQNEIINELQNTNEKLFRKANENTWKHKIKKFFSRFKKTKKQ